MWKVVLLVAACAGCGDVARTEPDARTEGMDATATAVPISPVAPTVGHPMYQGSQRDFRTQLGTTCKGRVAASMGSAGFCFLAADDSVKCAGMIGGVNFGMTPTTTGLSSVEQIMLFFSNNGMCMTRTDHTVWCMGSNVNAFGDTLTTAFGRWTARS